MSQKFLYLKVYNAIKEKITNQEYLPNEKLPTEQELSQQHQVSKITVKRALQMLRDDDYIYSIRGSGIYVMGSDSSPQKNTPTLPLITTDHSNIITLTMPLNMNESSFTGTITGVSQYLGEAGYFLNVRTGFKTINEEKGILNQMYDTKVAGIIHFPLFPNKTINILNKLFIENFPIITLDRYVECLPISSITTDNFKGGYDAVQYLLRLNHEKIGFLCDVGLEKFVSIRDRYLGYCQAMREGSTLKSEWIHVGFNHGYLHKHNEKIMSNIVEDYKKNGITAIFAANDRIASFFILSALKLGYQIPDDFSIIGFDNDTTLNTIHSKQITTMSQQYDKIGKLAAHNIVNLIEGKTDNVKITVEAKLIEKETCIKR